MSVRRDKDILALFHDHDTLMRASTDEVGCRIVIYDRDAKDTDVLRAHVRNSAKMLSRMFIEQRVCPKSIAIEHQRDASIRATEVYVVGVRFAHDECYETR